MKIGLRTVKTAVAAVLAMLLAGALNLLYAPSAGIIAVLSVGNTKKSSVDTALARLISLGIATSLSFLCFTLIGYNALAFGVYLLLFISISAKFQLTDGIVVNSVLVTHYMMEESYSWLLIKNEFLLMTIGVGFALLLNLYMPDIEKQLKQKQLNIEENFREILSGMVRTLNQNPKEMLDKECQKLLIFIRQGQQKAQMYQENQWQRTDVYYEEYFSMRRTQVRMLSDMVNLLKDIEVEETLVENLRPLLEFTVETFHEANDGTEILKRIDAVYEIYRMKPLPQDREEFENRARLFQFLQSFKSFIEIKTEFSKSIAKLNEETASE
ncbi:aromatic acid exporter family protein [Enterococcus olivae]